MPISSLTVIAIFMQASSAASSPIALDAFEVSPHQIERQLDELLELFEVEWELVKKDLEKDFESLPRKVEERETNGVADNGSLQDAPRTSLGDSPVGGDDHRAAAAWAVGETNWRRGRRQAPPNTIYRRPQAPPRPCRRKDGTSAVFTGSNAMSYISFLANVMALVLNINNNVNNNNNNNNINSNNNIDNNNANLNINSNNVNQVNIMPPGGRRRRRRNSDAQKSLTCQPRDKGMVELVLDTAVKEAWRSLSIEAQVM
ncbi:bifunctional glycosyltransferase pgtA-like [Macrobrachium nipponense]|uniref:bifunctional glycosyltransferase pgtA-like n=1 Tax=Macrobrachium nipponense TaxID=159736 RepID=UPI0030C7AE94